MVYAPIVMNSPWAMLITPIWPKMIARPSPISRSTENRLRPAKPCITPMFIISDTDMLTSWGWTGRDCLLVALGERVRLDQLRRLRHHLERGVGHAHGDARLAPQVVVGIQLHVAFGRGLQLDAGRGGDDLVDVEALGLF